MYKRLGNCTTKTTAVFSARQHAQRDMLSPVQLPVRMSVIQVNQSKTAEIRIMQFSPYGSPIPLVFPG